MRRNNSNKHLLVTLCHKQYYDNLILVPDTVTKGNVSVGIYSAIDVNTLHYNKGKPTDPPPGLEKRILRSRPCVAFLTFFPNRQPSILGEVFFKSVIAQWCWCRTEALEVRGSSPSGGFLFFPEFFFWASVRLAVTQFFLRLC